MQKHLNTLSFFDISISDIKLFEAMMKKPAILFVFFFLLAGIAYADEFDEAINLVQSRVPCSSLADNQLEMIGDYYMEQMHPGSLHEVMDERMGGEGSESLRQVHINIAKSFYCGQSGAMPVSMMNVMTNRAGGGMMGYNMMGYSSGLGYGFTGWIYMLLFWAAIIFLIVWAIRQFSAGKESSHEILEKRFARGEISKKEYEEMKKMMRR